MTKRSLEIFIATAECESMSKAARKLFITQSSVSQVISEIEKDYSVLLFDRLSKNLHLTEIGRELLTYARRILSMDTEMDDFLRCAATNQKVRLGATLTVGTCVISPILLQLKREIPNLDMETLVVANTNILAQKLLNSELDICLVEGRIAHPNLTVHQALDDRLVMICSPQHPFCGRHTVGLKEISACPLIFREQGSGTRAQIENEFCRRQLPMKIIWDCSNTEAILNAVADNHGISILSERLVLSAAKTGRIWQCPISDANFNRSFDLVYHKDKYITPTIQHFIDLVYSFEHTVAQ